MKFLEFGDMKKEPYLSINVNGRVPAIEDPNTGITLWESGAIIEYLVETYDKSSTLTYATTKERFLLKQWLYFQMSGQGPYYGQAAWFSFFHPEKIEGAVTRYRDQVLRVISVLNRQLEGREYLVGDKATYADLAFVPWNANVHGLLGPDFDAAKDYPNFAGWHKRITERLAVAKVLKAKIEASKH